MYRSSHSSEYIVFDPIPNAPLPYLICILLVSELFVLSVLFWINWSPVSQRPKCALKFLSNKSHKLKIVVGKT